MYRRNYEYFLFLKSHGANKFKVIFQTKTFFITENDLIPMALVEEVKIVK